MSHPEQLGFLAMVARQFRDVIQGGSVLEIGSYDVNGSVRALFASAAAYTGVDLVPGPGVDLVAFGHEVPFPGGSFDAVISAECLEHDPNWVETFSKMVEITRPRGLVAMTCASRGRPEHGTSRTIAADSPGTQFRGLDYYRNLQERDFQRVFDLPALFSAWRFYYLPTHFDLYFVGVKSGPGPAIQPSILPSRNEVEQMAGWMSLPHRLARSPLYLLSRLLPEGPYQAFAARYWFWLDRACSGRFRRANVGRGNLS